MFFGGGVEPVMTGGMDNPVEVAFSRGGERFFSSTFIQHPGGGQRAAKPGGIFYNEYAHGFVTNTDLTGTTVMRTILCQTYQTIVPS